MRNLFTTFALLFASIVPTTALCMEATAPASASQHNEHKVRKPNGRPSVAVVLAGGGAKGIAHIGALKVIEEAGIPIDLVVGNSMGAIVGGLYSVGYTPQEMDSIVRAQDWMPLLLDKPDVSKENLAAKKADTYLMHFPFTTDRKELKANSLTNMGMIQGRRVIELLNALTADVPKDVNFDDLPTQFCCIATDANTGKVYEFHEGDIVEAIRSSMAIPGVFTPIQKDSMLLVDGFVANNFPVDVAIKMGADIIIGVNLEIDPSQALQINNVADMINRLLDINYQDFLKRNIESSTLYIPIDVTGYSAASFTNRALDSLMCRGENCSRKLLPDLEGLRKQILGDKPYPGQPRRVLREEVPSDTLDFKEKNQMIADELSNTAKKVMHMTAPGLITQVHKSYNKSQLNVGVRYDNVEDASALLNANLKLSDTINTSVDLTVRLGDRIKAGVNLNYKLFGLPHFSVGYEFEHRNINYYCSGVKSFECTDDHNRIAVQWWQSWRKVFYYFGARYDIYKPSDILINPSLNLPSPDSESSTKWRHLKAFPRIYPSGNERYFTYYAYAEYNNKNTTYFPQSGTEVSAHLEVISDNLYQYDDKGMIPIVSCQWETVASLNSRFTIIPSLSGRFIFYSDDIPFSMENIVGGLADHHLLEQQITTAGLGDIQVANNYILTANVMLRQRIGANHFIFAKGGCLAAAPELDDYLNSQHDIIWGLKAGYSFRSVIGPLSFFCSYNNHTRKVGAHLNLGYYF